MNFEKIKKEFPGIRVNEPLKSHSTFRVGGPADFFFDASKKEDLMRIISYAHQNQIPYTIIGRGTNILFTDKGYRGLIIKNLTNAVVVKGTEVHCDSGALWAQIINEAVKHGLTGMEALCGMPGSVGAAVYGNAGVPGVETSKFIKSFDIFNPRDGLKTIEAKILSGKRVFQQLKNNIVFEYRHTSLQDSGDIVVSVVLEFIKGNSEHSKAEIKRINEARLAKQPIGFSAGSFFKNPLPDKPAGMLIDQVGLKGFRVGDAEISIKHGNFFLNLGSATCADILALRDAAINAVQEKFGISLHMEVKLIGEL